MSVARSGWAEILVGLLALGVVGILGGVLIARLPIGPVAIGLIFTALSGVAGMGGGVAALVAGLSAGEVFRRSGSVWPAVMVHVVVNLPTIPVTVLAGMSD